MNEQFKYNLLASGELVPYFVDGDVYINGDINIDFLEKLIDLNYTTPCYKIYVLYPDETINYEIPENCIKIGGTYNENYQSGQRRSLNFTLYNEEGKFSPDINNLWVGTRLRLDVGVNNGKNTIWFVRGHYFITKTSPSNTTSGKEVAISASDKFCVFENAIGRLDETYEIPEGEDIKEVIQSIQMSELGNGYIRDPKPLFFDASLEGKKTQVTITKNAGETYGDILKELATQLSAEYFYSASGNLTFVPIGDSTKDKEKPMIYFFNATEGDFGQLNFDYDYNSIVNRVVVIGNSNNGGVYKAIAVNGDEKSPLCWQRIGYRTDNIINDSNIYSDTLAQERAEYELRQKIILKTTSTTPILFNPFLFVNNLIGVANDFYSKKYERFLLQSISFSLNYSGQMSISFSNIDNLSTEIEVYNPYK